MLKNGSLRRLNVRPPLCNGLTSRPHVSECADGVGRRRIIFARHRAQSQANRLVWLTSFFVFCNAQEAERCRRLVTPNFSGERLSLGVTKHQCAALELVCLFDQTPQYQLRRKPYFSASNIKIGEKSVLGSKLTLEPRNLESQFRRGLAMDSCASSPIQRDPEDSDSIRGSRVLKNGSLRRLNVGHRSAMVSQAARMLANVLMELVF